MRKIYTFGLLPALLFVLFSSLNAQDTLRVMQYNLLRYGCSGVDTCTPTGVTQRNVWFEDIMGWASPDIFGVNEIGPFESPTSPAENVLINVLHDFDTDYERAQVTFNGSQDVVNGMFYRSSKLGLAQQSVIQHSLRDINYYNFYYKGPGLATGDTTWIEVVVVHLHASNSTTRGTQTQAIMSYLDGLNRSGNFIVMGDFNLNGSTEQSYQNMVAHTNANTKMNDPINTPGTWGNNNNVNHTWTQSTRNSTSGDCGSGGGLDDRFDIILCSNDIINNGQDVKYIPNSYFVMGNPNAPNPTLPGAVSGALVPMSDHYPVLLELEISQAVARDPRAEAFPEIKLLDHPASGEARFEARIPGGWEGSYTLRLTDLRGKVLRESAMEWSAGRHRETVATQGLASGLYLLQVLREDRALATARLMISQ